MRALHALIINKSGCLVSVTADDPDSALATIEPLVAGIPDGRLISSEIPFACQSGGPKGIEISSSVNFVANTWACATDEFRPFFVLAKNLSTGYLWNKIRVEGWAYGGMALISSGHPLFACASYRDPNLISTLGHFEEGLRQAAHGLPADAVDQNVIATIGRIDAPQTPHGKGLGETIALLCGRTPEIRQRTRESVLSVSPETLSRAAQRLLDEKRTAITILGSPSAFDQAQKEGLQLTREKLIA